MNGKSLTNILDYLKVIRTVYSSPNWGGGHEDPVTTDAIANFRNFWDILPKNIPLEEIPEPNRIFPHKEGLIGIEWEKVSKSPYYMDLFYVFISPNEQLIYESDLGSLGTGLTFVSELKEDLDEQLLIHIKHFS